MADFDTIYEERDEEDDINVDTYSIVVPDPIIIRGAGNVTMYDHNHFNRIYYWGFIMIMRSYQKSFKKR